MGQPNSEVSTRNGGVEPHLIVSMISSNMDKLAYIKRYAKILDSQFKIPGTRFKFGIDPLLSLIPVVGTFSGLVTGMILIFLASKHGISGEVRIKMIINTLVDYLLGLVPILGNLTDFIYKSNDNNVKLLEEYWLENKHIGTGWKQIIIITIILLVIVCLGVALSIYILKWLIRLF